MCNLISSEVVIGNILIEAAKRNIKKITINDFIKFDLQINTILREKNFSTRFSVSELNEFHSNYPYFVSFADDDAIHLEMLADTKPQLDRLITYFRAGLPTNIVDYVSKTSDIVFNE